MSVHSNPTPDDAIELEPSSGTPITAADDSRRHMPEPPPVRLIAVGDVVVPARRGLEAQLDAFYVDVLRFERSERPAGAYASERERAVKMERDAGNRPAEAVDAAAAPTDEIARPALGLYGEDVDALPAASGPSHPATDRGPTDSNSSPADSDSSPAGNDPLSAATDPLPLDGDDFSDDGPRPLARQNDPPVAHPHPRADPSPGAYRSYRAERHQLRVRWVDQRIDRESLRPVDIEVPSLAELEDVLVTRVIAYEHQRGIASGSDTLLLQDPAGNWVRVGEAQRVG